MTTTSSASQTDPRAKRWGIFAKYAAILVVGFFVAPYIWVAIGGLIGMLAAGAIMLGTWMTLPWLALKTGNLRLALVTHEAATNPVPTLQNELQRQQQALDERKTAIGHLRGQIATFEDKLGALGKRFGKGDDSYVKMAAQLASLKRVADNRDEKWQAAYVQVGKFEQEIERASMIWDAAQAAAAAQESSGLTEKDFMAQLQRETALDSIRSTFNDTIASLDTDLMQADAEKTLNASDQAALPSGNEAIEVNVTPVNAKSRTSR